MATRSSPNHYEVLGVAIDAPVDDIRKAYRALAKTTHPDAGGDSATFRQVLEAYQVLTNPLTRKEYDDKLDVELRIFRRPEPEEGFTGRQGFYTGEVEFPAYLRDVVDAPWEGFGEDRSAGEARVSSPRPADVLWWWQQPVDVHPVLAGHLVVVATPDHLVALDALSGREVWRAGMPGAPATPPVVSGEVIVAWTDDGTVHGIEATRGITRWEQRLGPCGFGGLVVAGATVVAAGGERRLSGLDPASGQVRWTARVTSEPTQPLVSVGGLVVVGTALGVEAVEARKGRYRWRAPARLPVDLPLLASGESVWVSAGGGRLHRLDVRNGAGLATWDVSTPIAGLASDGSMLFATVAGPAQLVAVDGAGWVRWATGTSVVCPEPALIAGTAYLAEPSNRLTAVDTVDGRTIASSTLPFEPIGPPVPAVDRVVVRERGGFVWCIALPER